MRIVFYSWDIGVTTATLGFDPKRRGLTPLYPSNFKNT